MNKAKSLIIFITLLVIASYMVGCAYKVRLSEAESALTVAQEAGAESSPLYGEAQDLIARAKELMSAGKKDEAVALLEEAKFKAITAKGEITEQNYAKIRSDAELQKEIARLKSQQFTSSNVLQDIFFDFDSSEIIPASRQELDRTAEYIMKNPSVFEVIVIEGYCDTRGTEEYNLALGQRRASVVKLYLIGKGVPASLVKAVSRGETNRWGAGMSDYEYSQNRRAHFTVK